MVRVNCEAAAKRETVTAGQPTGRRVNVCRDAALTPVVDDHASDANAEAVDGGGDKRLSCLIVVHGQDADRVRYVWEYSARVLGLPDKWEDQIDLFAEASQEFAPRHRLAIHEMVAIMPIVRD